MARTATTAAASAAPRAPWLLRAALLLLLLVAACRPAAAAPVITELRCQCRKTLERIHPMYIKTVQVTSPGSYCGQTEVIVTHKDGNKVCLNPDFSQVNMVLEELIKTATTKVSTVDEEAPAVVVSVSVESQ